MLVFGCFQFTVDIFSKTADARNSPDNSAASSTTDVAKPPVSWAFRFIAQNNFWQIVATNLFCHMLREVFQLFFADEFLVSGDFAQQMDCVFKRFLRFILSRFAQEEMNLEFFPRIMQRHAPAQPLVCLLTDAARINQIK